jgi:hypothetical protein
MNGENSEKIHVIETKTVNSIPADGFEKARGEKMKVSSIMLLKTHGENLSETGLSIMLMKIKQIKAALHYIHEKKVS